MGVLPETMITDLRRIADEIARIECEFEGAVNCTVVPNSNFRVALDALNVRFSSVGQKRPHDHIHSSSFVPYRFFSTTFIEIGR